MQPAARETGHGWNGASAEREVGSETPARPGSQQEPASSGEGRRSVEKDLARVGEELLELARLRWHRVRLVAKESAHGILVALWLGLVGLIVTIVAAYYLVTGAAGALTELVGGHPWVGRLTIGAAGVGGGWLVLRLLRSRMRRLFVDSMNRTASEQAHPESESSHAA